MQKSKITHKITQGVYVLTTRGGGCIVDAVSRGGSKDDQPLITVSVAKTNHSHQLLEENKKFALSVLGKAVDPDIIQTFGFKSSKDCDKCQEVETEEVSGVPVVKKSLGYMICEKIDSIDMGTHTLYIGKMVQGDLLEDAEPMDYAYYQEHKAELVRTDTSKGQTAWVCTACGYIYYGDEVPEDYKCPLCGLGKKFFKRK